MSSSGCSKSSASGIVHADGAGAEKRLAVGHERLAAIDRESARADHHFLRADQEVQEHRHATGMLGTELLDGREGGAGILARRDADPAGIRLAHAAVLRAGAIVRERLSSEERRVGKVW